MHSRALRLRVTPNLESAMKHLSIRTLVLSCLVLLPAAPRVVAEETPPAEEGRELGPGGGSGAKERLQMLAQELNLTAGQREEIGSLLQQQVEKARALHDDMSLSRRQKFKKMKVMREETRAQIRALLTPEQQAKYDLMPRPRRGR